MNYGSEYLKEEARKRGEHWLQQAAKFIEMSSKTSLFQKRMGKGATAVLVRVGLTGVVTVFDTDTGNVLAVSLPGKPAVLDPDFVPVVPALAGPNIDSN